MLPARSIVSTNPAVDLSSDTINGPHVTTYGIQASVRLRILISVAIAIASGAFCWLVLSRLHLGAGDFGWSVRASRFFFSGGNPYDRPEEQYLYPMTAAIFGLPFLKLAPEIAGGAFYGLSSGLLAFGLTKTGYHRLLVFLAYPYWAGFLPAQWAPLILAGAFFPFLLPATMAKPQVGLPVALTYFSKRGLIACVVVILLTLIALPKWPLWWMQQFGHYEYSIPLLVLPGPFLLLALWRWRDRDTWLLLLAAAMPQRYFFDSFTLWLIPKTRREIVWTAFVSWGAGIWRWYHIPHTYTQIGRWTLIFIYLPMLVVLLARKFSEGEAIAPQPSSGTT